MNRRRRGMVFVEFMVYLFAFVTLFSVLYAGWTAFAETQARLDTASEELDEACRLLDDVKRDLRAATSVKTEASRAGLRTGDLDVEWRFDAASGTVTRTAADDVRVYPESFEAFTIREGSSRTVEVALDLKRSRGDAPFRPRLGTWVFLGNRE